MADAHIFMIENGQFGLALVDKTESGYMDSWQAPGGATADTATIADYDAGAATWSCQITSGALNASPNLTTTDIPATWCAPAKTIPQPGETSYTFDFTFMQDPDVNPANSLNAFLFEFDTQEAYFFAGMAGAGLPPAIIGRCRLIAGTVGGAARVQLTADVSLPVSRKPDMWVGDGTTNRVIRGDGTTGTVAATGATAGSPGSWTPSGSTPPANAAGATTAGVVASPATAWTTGQYVQGSNAGTGGEAYWNGTAWTAGKAT